MRLVPCPTLRLDHALAVVRDRLDFWAGREAARTRRGGEAWMTLGRIERAVDWSGDGDRIVVEMWAESSAGEGNAEAAGRAWLERLVAEQPEYAGVVDVIGLSH